MNTAQRDSSARILVVDDDARITQLVCHLLGNFGYRVCSAKNGCDALAILEETSHADLIIADVIMPRMGGPQLVREMHAKGIHIPVIFLSGYTDDRLTTYGFDMDGVSLIPKPFSADRLLHQVKQVLSANP